MKITDFDMSTLGETFKFTMELGQTARGFHEFTGRILSVSGVDAVLIDMSLEGNNQYGKRANIRLAPEHISSIKPVKETPTDHERIDVEIGHTYRFTEVLGGEPREFTARVLGFDDAHFTVRRGPDRGSEGLYYKHIRSAVEVETPNDTVTHLEFIYDRMVQCHGDDHKADYIVRFKEVIDKVTKRRSDHNNLLATMRWADKVDRADKFCTIAEHPDYPKEAWRSATRDGDTFKSYKDWAIERAWRNQLGWPDANERPR